MASTRQGQDEKVRGQEKLPMVDFVGSDMEKETDEQSRDKSLKGLLHDHADKSSISGIIFIRSSKYLVVKLIWTLLLLVALGVMVYHLHELGSKYFSYQKQTQVELTSGQIRLPAVTLCNANAVKHSKRGLATPKLMKLMNKVDPSKLIEEVLDWKIVYENDTYFYDDSGDFLYNDDDFYYDGDDGDDDDDDDDDDGYAVDDDEGDNDDDSNKRKRRRKRSASKKATKMTMENRANNFLDDLNVADDDFDYFDVDFRGETYKDSWESESKPASLDKLFKSFTTLYSKMNSTVRQRMGHKIRDMLVQCSFSGRKCFQSNFTLFPSTKFGNCYTLQYDRFVSRASGPENGLSLILYLETDDYLPGIANSKGAQLVIHEPHSVAFPDDEGLVLGAGTETLIGLRKVAVRRLGQPHGNCSQPASFEKMYGMKYTTRACLQICLAKTLLDKCNCYDISKPRMSAFARKKKTIKECQLRSDTTVCQEDVEWMFNVEGSNCDCSSPCRETSYRHTISTKPWPTESFAKLLASTVCKDNPKSALCDVEGMSEVKLRENFVKVTVFFESLNYERFEEQADYTLFQFISDIGGTVGLYVGLSVLAFFELLHLLGAIARHFLCPTWTPTC